MMSAARPVFLYSAISRMVSTDSCFAGSMKLHVLTTMTSASEVRRKLVAGRGELTHHDLAINEVLRAAETDKSNFQGCGSYRRRARRDSPLVVELFYGTM